MSSPQSFVSWAQSHRTDEKSRLRKRNNAFWRVQLRKWLGGGGKCREERELEEGCGTWKWGREVNIHGVITSSSILWNVDTPKALLFEMLIS